LFYGRTGDPASPCLKDMASPFQRLTEPTSLHFCVKLQQNLTSSCQVIVSFLILEYESSF